MKKIFYQIHKFKKPMVWGLLALNLILAGTYTYAVNRTVFNVVAATKAEKDLAQTSATAADLESEYVSLKNKITLDFAYSQGFRDASADQIFIASKSTSKSLSFNAL